MILVLKNDLDLLPHGLQCLPFHAGQGAGDIPRRHCQDQYGHLQNKREARCRGIRRGPLPQSPVVEVVEGESPGPLNTGGDTDEQAG